jgi:hypothetical protein
MRPGHTYHPSCDDFVETRAEMRARVAARRDASPTGLGYALTSITLTILALLSAVPGAHAQAAIDCASTTAALGTLGACQTGANAGCCAALTSWNDAGCFCDGVTTAVSQVRDCISQIPTLFSHTTLTLFFSDTFSSLCSLFLPSFSSLFFSPPLSSLSVRDVLRAGHRPGGGVRANKNNRRGARAVRRRRRRRRNGRGRPGRAGVAQVGLRRARQRQPIHPRV